MAAVTQRSFTKGEISPSLQARADTVGYATGLKVCRNNMVQPHGGLQNRPGFVYLHEVKDSSKQVRLFPFVFNDDQTYVLEFGENYVRFFKDGSILGPGTVTAWSNATAYVVGDLASVAGVNYYCILAHTNHTPANATYWYPMPAGIYEIPSSFLSADLPLVKYVQSADVLTFVHPSYATQELKRYSETNWTFLAKTFIPATQAPITVANNGAATVAQYNISDYAALNPARVVTSAAHGRTTGDIVRMNVDFQVLDHYIYYTTQNFSGTFKVNVIDTTTLELLNIDGSNFTFNFRSVVYFLSPGGTVTATVAGSFKTNYVVTAIDPTTGEESLASLPTGTTAIATTSAPITISWAAVSGVKEYNIYKQQNSVEYGFIGNAAALLFLDNGIIPDVSFTPPAMDANAFAASDEYPSAVGYYQQRLMLGAPNSNVEKVFGSRTGNFKNFSARDPLLDDDSLSFVMTGEKVSKVLHFVDIGKLLILTQSGPFVVEGDSAGALTPASINARQYSHFGSSDVKPIVIGSTIVFVQSRNKKVRDLSFDISTNYKSMDLTLYANHLFKNRSVSELAYQENANSILWAIMDDGALLGLTYVKEENVIGWHRHDTDGEFESITCIPEGSEDAVYVVVKRTINNATKRYIERMANREFEEIIDCIFMDSALTYDGRNTGSTTMTLTGGTNWDKNEQLLLTASAAFFTSGDIGNAVHFTDSDGMPIKCVIEAYTSTTIVTVRPHKTVPVALRSVATTTWARAVDAVSGLGHLEGKEVSVLADGYVIASPNNKNFNTVKTVTSGAITLAPASNPATYAVVHVGLPYNSDVETLDIEDPNTGTQITKSKLVNEVSIRVESSRGFFVGRKLTDEGIDGLDFIKLRELENMDEPTMPSTGVFKRAIQAEWNKNGRVVMRQVDPLPLAIDSISPTGYLEGK